MEIVTVIENTVGAQTPELDCEPGLSFYFDYNGKKILFDTGVSDKMIENARKLNIPLEEIDICVISHWHFDHTGGLEKLLELNKKVKVYIKESDSSEFYFKLGFLKKYIGVPVAVFKKYSDRLVYLKDDIEPVPGFSLLTKITQKRPLVKGNRKLLEKTGSGFTQDDFSHELVASLKVNDGVVIITGCSHNGVLNMVDTVKEKYPDEAIVSVIGGFHLMGIPLLKNSMSVSPAEAEDIAREMLDYGIKKTYTMHCTGPRAYAIMKNVMGDRLDYLASGDRVKF